MNPNNPPQDVSLGESTTDEMMLFYFTFAFYQPGDENIVIDSTAIVSIYDPGFADIIHTPQLYDPSPNPSNEFVNLSFYLPRSSDVVFKIMDLKGAVVQDGMQHFDAGLNLHSINMEKISNGEYILEMTADGVRRSKKIIKE